MDLKNDVDGGMGLVNIFKKERKCEDMEKLFNSNKDENKAYCNMGYEKNVKKSCHDYEIYSLDDREKNCNAGVASNIRGIHGCEWRIKDKNMSKDIRLTESHVTEFKEWWDEDEDDEELNNKGVIEWLMNQKNIKILDTGDYIWTEKGIGWVHGSKYVKEYHFKTLKKDCKDRELGCFISTKNEDLKKYSSCKFSEYKDWEEGSSEFFSNQTGKIEKIPGPGITKWKCLSEDNNSITNKEKEKKIKEIEKKIKEMKNKK